MGMQACITKALSSFDMFMLSTSKAAQKFIKFVWNFWSYLISTSIFKQSCKPYSRI